MFSPDSPPFFPVKYFPGHQRERKWTISVSSETKFSPGRGSGVASALPPALLTVRVAGAGGSQEIFSVTKRGGGFEFQATRSSGVMVMNPEVPLRSVCRGRYPTRVSSWPHACGRQTGSRSQQSPGSKGRPPGSIGVAGLGPFWVFLSGEAGIESGKGLWPPY